jgi:phosphoribosylamine--glycine ligase
MRFFVVSGFGCGLSFWHRLQCEGHDVRVWIKDDNKTVGDGIVPKVGTYDEGVKWAKEAPSIVLFESSGCGDRADQARKAGLAVVGGGSYMDRLENDREFGFKVAEQAGCLIPPYKEFPNVAATIAWARSNKVKPSFWKTDKYLDARGR